MIDEHVKDLHSIPNETKKVQENKEDNDNIKNNKENSSKINDLLNIDEKLEEEKMTVLRAINRITITRYTEINEARQSLDKLYILSNPFKKIEL